MPLIELKRNPSRRELRWFGVLLALFAAIVGALFRWQFKMPAVAQIVWPLGGATAALYYLVPPIRRPVYMGWMYMAYPIGWVVSHALLAAIYYVLFTLTGMLMRLVGYDPMERRFDRSASTYWVPHNPHGDTARYFRQS